MINGSLSTIYCDQTTDNGGWLVIQRNKGNGFFSRTWLEYKEGFGDINENFWWGNEKIHNLTQSSNYELRVDLMFGGGHKGYRKYNGFKLSSEADGYRLLLSSSSGSGNISNSLFYPQHIWHQSVGNRFSTKDRDNDQSSGSCAAGRKSGWWYSICSNADLNRENTMLWRSLTDIQQSEMKIRPTD